MLDHAQLDTEGILFYSRDRIRDFNNQKTRLADLRSKIEMADKQDDEERQQRERDKSTST